MWGHSGVSIYIAPWFPIAVGATWEYRIGEPHRKPCLCKSSLLKYEVYIPSRFIGLVYIPPKTSGTKSILPNSAKKANKIKTHIKDNKWLVQRRIYLASDFQYIQVKVSHQDWPTNLVHCVPICFRYTYFTHTQTPKMFIDSVQISSKHQVCWLITIYLKLVGWQHLWRSCKQHVCWRYNSMLSSMTRRSDVPCQSTMRPWGHSHLQSQTCAFLRTSVSSSTWGELNSFF